MQYAKNSNTMSGTEISAVSLLSSKFLFIGALVSVYIQERRLDTALYARGLPELREFTIHMWYYGVPDDDNRTDDIIFSFYSPSKCLILTLSTFHVYLYMDNENVFYLGDSVLFSFITESDGRVLVGARSVNMRTLCIPNNNNSSAYIFTINMLSSGS